MRKNPLDRPVKDFLGKSYCAMDADKTILDAVKCMDENKTGTVIVTEDGKPVGVITEKDIVYKVILREHNPSEIKLKDVMSSPIIKVSPDTPLKDALKIMVEKNVRRILVTEDDKLLGLVTLKANLCALHIQRLEKRKQPKSWLQKHIEEVTSDVLEHFEELFREVSE